MLARSDSSSSLKTVIASCTLCFLLTGEDFLICTFILSFFFTSYLFFFFFLRTVILHIYSVFIIIIIELLVSDHFCIGLRAFLGLHLLQFPFFFVSFVIQNDRFSLFVFWLEVKKTHMRMIGYVKIKFDE